MNEVKTNPPIRRDEIYEWEKDNLNLNKAKEMNKEYELMNDSFNIYFKSYIGFKSISELKIFQKYFNKYV